MEQNKSLGLLSLARKGGNIVLGEEQAGAAARASRARLMLLASDAGGHTVRRAKSFVAGTAQPLLTLPYTRDELGDALGTTSCAIAAITDVQLALAFVKTLGEPEKYADLLQELDERVKRVEKRRAGKRHQPVDGVALAAVQGCTAGRHFSMVHEGWLLTIIYKYCLSDKLSLRNKAVARQRA